MVVQQLSHLTAQVLQAGAAADSRAGGRAGGCRVVVFVCDVVQLILQSVYNGTN